MTVILRLALRNGVEPDVGTLWTLLTCVLLAGAYAGIQGQWDLGSAWPFLLAGVLAPGLSQTLFTFAVRDIGASRTSLMVGTAPLFAVFIALVFLREPLVGGLIGGAVMIVAGGGLLVTERTRPDNLRTIGIAFAIAATLAFAVRDSLIRRLGEAAEGVEPGLAALATLVAGAVMSAVIVVRRRSALRPRAARGFVVAGLLYGCSYLLLFEAFYRGPVTVISPLIATESLWAVVLSALILGKQELIGRRLLLGAALVVGGGILIGVYR